jgi:ABC-2 type transport system permease protein
MRNVWVICQKELNSYFASPVAYGLLVFFGLLIGYFTSVAVANFTISGLQAQSMGQAVDVNEWVVRPVVSNAGIFGLFLIPMIAMRLFSEEKRTGTFELLATSPVTDWEIILGKWLGAVALYTCMLAIAAIDIGLLFAYGQPDWRPILTGFLGLILQGGALLALGSFISTTTKNQIVAGAATFGVCLLLWLCSWISDFKSDGWAQVVSYASVMSHSDSFNKGVIDSKDVIYYLTVIFFGLFLTSRSLESLRWRA